MQMLLKASFIVVLSLHRLGIAHYAIGWVGLKLMRVTVHRWVRLAVGMYKRKRYSNHLLPSFASLLRLVHYSLLSFFAQLPLSGHAMTSHLACLTYMSERTACIRIYVHINIFDNCQTETYVYTYIASHTFRNAPIELHLKLILFIDS